MNDLHFSFRQILKNPGYAAVAVMTLALGIGAAASVFTLGPGGLMTPPAYPRPDDILLIRTANAQSGALLSAPTTEQWTGWQRESRSFEMMAGYDWQFDYLLLRDGGEAVSGLAVTPEYFDLIGIKPLL